MIHFLQQRPTQPLMVRRKDGAAPIRNHVLVPQPPLWARCCCGDCLQRARAGAQQPASPRASRVAGVRGVQDDVCSQAVNRANLWQRLPPATVSPAEKESREMRSFDQQHFALCLSQIKSEYIGDAARPGLEGEEYALPSEPCAIGAHPGPTIGACASHYSCACRKSNPNILVMQPAQDWKAKNTPCPLNRAR